MSDNRAAQVGSFLAAFAIGAVAGAGLALLFAPRSGQETRKRIADKGRELTGRAAEVIDDATDFIEDESHGMGIHSTPVDA